MRDGVLLEYTVGGIGVIESLSTLPPKLRPTLVVLTNYAFPEFETATIERGADYFFDKSSEIEEVVNALKYIREDFGDQQKQKH